jgi:hypothetical protein
MSRVETTKSALVEQGRERQLSVQAGSLFGIDLRPSRLFLWLGDDRRGQERVVSLDRPPKVLRGQPRRRFLKLGAAEISYLGNPAVTLGLSAYNYGRRVLADVESKERDKTG